MKTCPTCGARAFDDAEVCYGCLHRYGEDPARPAGSPTAPDPGPVPGPAPARASVPADARCPAARLAVPVPQPKAGSAAPLRDKAGWTVRFELPGYEHVMDSNGLQGGFVVRFQPDGSAPTESAERDRVTRGTHARDAPANSRALANAAGCP